MDSAEGADDGRRYGCALHAKANRPGNLLDTAREKVRSGPSCPIHYRIMYPHSALNHRQVRAMLLRLLGEGHKDEVIARKPGISVRTCRRHISELMRELGAAGRFQAGLPAAKLGLRETD